jgi:hypothetical protein
MEPQQDKGNQAEATRVAAAIIQGTPDLVAWPGLIPKAGRDRSGHQGSWENR